MAAIVDGGSYQNNNVPVTDLLYPLTYLPKWHDVTSVGGSGVKDETGRYVEGTVKITHEFLEGGYQSSYNAYTYQAECFMRNSQLRWTQGANKLPMCVIAIPIKFGFTNGGQSGIPLQQEKNLVQAYGGRVAYCYFLAVRGDASSLRRDGLGLNANVIVAASVDSEYADKYPSYFNTSNQMNSETLSSFGMLNNLSGFMKLANIGRDNFYNTERFRDITIKQAEIWGTGGDYNDLGKEIGLRTLTVNMITGSMSTSNASSFQVYPIIGAKIISTIPVFNIEKPQAIYNYFENGSISGADNLPDLMLSEISLATDWIIYVKGARYPNIYVTMASTELDDFLASEQNRTGLTEKDFKIQYMYPSYDYLPPGQAEASGEYVELPDMTYNDMKTTSFNEIVELMLSDIKVADKFTQSMYAELRFRIYYDDEIWSRWCYFKIGYIGSPSVPDFVNMNNEGDVVSISDGSTVTIIYDEFPPDDDDYTNPKDDGDIGEGDDKKSTQPKDNTNDGLNLLTVTYRMSRDDLDSLGNFLWNNNFFENIKLLNNSPIENIVGLKVMPCNVSATTSSVVIGNVDTEINGDVVTNVPVVNIGSFNFTGYYGSFLDYAPYTQAAIFLPFIGFIELDPAQFTGHTLNVKYAFDVIMGQCKAMLFADGIYVASYDGVCGIDVPLVASNRAQVESSAIASMAGSALSGDVVGLTAAYATRQYHSQRAGGYSPTLGWAETRTCFIVLTLPNANYPSSYGHDVGFPCNLTCTLGTLSGFTVCDSNIDMRGFTCTEQEKEEIKGLLTSGVYL